MRLDMTWALSCQRPLCVACDEMVMEAWERQSTGGVEVPYYQELRGALSLRGIVRVGGGLFFHAARRF